MWLPRDRVQAIFCDPAQRRLTHLPSQTCAQAHKSRRGQQTSVGREAVLRTMIRIPSFTGHRKATAKDLNAAMIAPMDGADAAAEDAEEQIRLMMWRNQKLITPQSPVKVRRCTQRTRARQAGPTKHAFHVPPCAQPSSLPTRSPPTTRDGCPDNVRLLPSIGPLRACAGAVGQAPVASYRLLGARAAPAVGLQHRSQRRPARRRLPLRCECTHMNMSPSHTATQR